jgi:hypothetical protein
MVSKQQTAVGTHRFSRFINPFMVAEQSDQRPGKLVTQYDIIYYIVPVIQ